MVSLVRDRSASPSPIVRFWRTNAKTLFMLASLVFIVTLLSASVRMVKLAIMSQPECIEHQKSAQVNSSTHLAAKSSC